LVVIFVGPNLSKNQENSNNKKNSTMTASPMEIDPVDDGPRENPEPPIYAIPPPPPEISMVLVPPVTNAEEATIAIERLRSDDYSQRVLASHQLDSIARILGSERTRTVREEIISMNNNE
jgi:hypothetical protein